MRAANVVVGAVITSLVGVGTGWGRCRWPFGRTPESARTRVRQVEACALVAANRLNVLAWQAEQKLLDLARRNPPTRSRRSGSG